jgi:ATP-dependent DNA helicase RecG
MNITIDKLNAWIALDGESEILEFKEAKAQFDSSRFIDYCAAIANEKGGHIILGVSDKKPRKIVGTQAYSDINDLNAIKKKVLDKLRIRIDSYEVEHPEGRVLIFSIPSRPIGNPIEVDGRYLMRSGESLVGMTPDRIKTILAEGAPDWLGLVARDGLTADDVVSLLDTQSLFELLKLPYPASREGVLDKLKSEQLIVNKDGFWEITNLAAILLAKDLNQFSPALARKGVRVVIYDGVNKTSTKEDKFGVKGYAVGFSNLVEFIHSAAPLNKSVEQVIREEVKMFPKQALRELIANALVHQDFFLGGMSVMLEMYDDRVEVSNPGVPPINPDRFIDEYRSRNERLADLMRRLGICEEKGSGVDKVINAAEVYQLPPPDFRVTENRTVAIIYAHQDFSDMSKDDRIRACYQHCCLMYVSNQKMSNQTLRDRFGLSETKTAAVSTVIAGARDASLIRLDESETASTRYAKYVPYWA